MAYLSQRIYSVEVQTKSGITFDFAKNTIDYKRNTLNYDNFKIIFDIEKTLGTTPDKGSVQIYNLNEDSWNKLDIRKDDPKLILKCGYRDLKPEVIYQGEVIEYNRVVERTETIDVFNCGDGHRVLTNSSLNKTYESSMSIATILDDIIKEVKKTGATIAGDVKKKIADIAATSKKEDGGLSVSGLLKDTLETLLKPFNKTFTIQNDVLKIVEIGKESITGKYTILTPETGLIGSPSKTKDGLEFVALIQPGKFNPGQFVEIKSRKFNGRYKIIKSNFVGDTHGNDWYIRGICI